MFPQRDRPQPPTPRSAVKQRGGVAWQFSVMRLIITTFTGRFVMAAQTSQPPPKHPHLHAHVQRQKRPSWEKFHTEVTEFDEVLFLESCD